MTEKRLKEIEDTLKVHAYPDSPLFELIDNIRSKSKLLVTQGAEINCFIRERDAAEKENEKLRADIKECRKFCFDWSKENAELKDLLREARDWHAKAYGDHDTHNNTFLTRIDAALDGK